MMYRTHSQSCASTWTNPKLTAILVERELVPQTCEQRLCPAYATAGARAGSEWVPRPDITLNPTSRSCIFLQVRLTPLTNISTILLAYRRPMLI